LMDIAKYFDLSCSPVNAQFVCIIVVLVVC
jgi:hypothetical protein